MSAPYIDPSLSGQAATGPTLTPGSSEPDTREDGPTSKSKARFRTMAFPRKRAVTACDTCRWKKTKCGNERPVCASCAKNEWPCSYDPRLDHASFDPASLLILEKLNLTLQKLGDLDQEVKSQKTSRVIDDPRFTARTATTSSPSDVAFNATPSSSASVAPSDCLQVPTAFASAETILSWPVFNSRWPRNCLSQELLINSLPTAHRDPDSVKRGQGINEESVPGLVERFLQLVHSKNPVFHTRQIREAARHVAEYGIGWDASSCVVLLACALGVMARPYDPSPEAGLLSDRTSLLEASQLLKTSDMFYQVARKRIGLLEPSIVAGQCHMLAGIYLMYTLHPLEAWAAFHQAGSVYTLYLRSKAALQERSNGMDFTPSNSDRRLEQRLYWTVLKSECEFRVQLDLPQSDLYKLDYPFLFPSPPSPSSPVASPEDQIGDPGSVSAASTSSQLHSLVSASSPQHAEEQTWFYYLSEISLRRIQNRVLNAFYKEDHQHWLQMDPASMISVAEEIEAQVDTCHASLPLSIRFDGLEEKTDELRHMTQGRIVEIRRLLYRPFLYYAIHAPHQVRMRWDLTSTLKGFVQKCLAAHQAPAGIGLTHRHHGTWYELCEAFSIAMILLAAHMAELITINFQSLSSPQQAEDLSDNQQYARTLQVCVERLRYWEAEASPDIALARRIIEELLVTQRLVHQ
ncbi:hypothetical protein MBM_07178 [Drepanopeziza brunnea f. sp. 'multigermtubi' MB_m1]|uniref:Zn(2)-C6 fungal-type domain-containing protein n=1 Tax=Marssonina brunnea f. sp. multigermtubi (strain MB_m1) TaxID=1072389 RepID=K1WPX8_MARBU|nr:uncharacterized protein MBM_07178 [Drepanopeziza brunnea f. sp. 'multigermtubi' MB_m1]EKD14457.1 hypothetical protein MBM_07178 [Drepanopeziza brunnea f. sp. 'multigermtubi' MB_m1]